MSARKTLARNVGAIYYTIVVTYLLLPLLVIAPISFGDDPFMRFPPNTVSLRWYEAYFQDPQWLSATWLSARVAIGTSALATSIGAMAAIALERQRLIFANGWRTFIAAPLVVPHIFIAVGVFVLASRFGLTGNAAILVCAHTVLALPLVVMMISAPLRQLDPTLEMAARVMGAGPLRAFFAAALPSLLPAVSMAAVFSFFISFDELIIAEFLMTGHETLPMRIWADLKLQLNPVISAVSTLLISVTAAALALVEWLRRRGTADAFPLHQHSRTQT